MNSIVRAAQRTGPRVLGLGFRIYKVFYRRVYKGCMVIICGYVVVRWDSLMLQGLGLKIAAAILSTLPQNCLKSNADIPSLTPMPCQAPASLDLDFAP